MYLFLAVDRLADTDVARDERVLLAALAADVARHESNGGNSTLVTFKFRSE